MVIGKIKVTGTRAYTIEALDIPQGIVGATVSFDFSEDWAGLKKNVVFIGAKDVEILDIQDSVNLPPEVVAAQNVIVKVGVVGVNANKKMVIPTLWADLGTVKPGAPVDMGYDPTLPIWAQLLSMIGDLRNLNTVDKSNLVAAVNEVMSNSGGGNGAGAGGYYTPVVTQPTANTMMVSFVPSVATMPAVEPVTITLPGSDSGQNPAVATVEPAYEDIPKVFFGGALPLTKTEVVIPFRYISKTLNISGYCKIKRQGNSSLAYPKPNETVKMYEDAECTKKLKINFKGWGKQSKHVYKANWIDLTHARNIVTCWLWADMVKSRSNYLELPELYRTSPNHGAIDGFPVKVYSEGVYQGRFTLNIPKDAWMANMDDELETHCILYSENYDSGCFLSEAKIDGSDWSDEVHDTVPDSIKTRWNEIINFIQNSTDEEFIANLGNYFDIPSLIDYDLLGLLSCDLDGFGKNQFYLTYDGQKWIAGVYDKDATWGLYWNGNYFVPADYPRESYEDKGANLLYKRLEQLFSTELKARWAELKNGALSMANIINRFERFTDIAPPYLVEEDYAETTANGAFTGIPSRFTNNIQQIRAFALERTAWVATYLNNIVYTPCTGITLSASELTFTAEGSQTLIATVTPEDCSDTITWESDNPSVATVNDGVVTVIANGTAIITAKCGSHSASCTVSVSGLVEPVPCTGITLSANTLNFTAIGSQALTATVTPDGCTDPIVWESDKPAVATVVDGVVTAVGNGTATITAKCGNYSATCSVSVVKEAVTTYLFENGKPTAVPFYEETEIDFAAGDYIEAEIDVTPLGAGWGNYRPIAVGGDVTVEQPTLENAHMVVCFNPNTLELAAQYRGNSYASRGAAITEVPATILARFDYNGVTINDELLVPASDPYDRFAENIAAVRALTKVQVGAWKTDKSVYNYVKVVRV